MKVSIYGNNLEAYVVAISLALAGNDVKHYTKAFKSEGDEQGLIANEPGLKANLDKAISKQAYQEVNDVEFSEVDIHWTFYENSGASELFVFIDKLISSSNSVSLVLSTTLGIGTYKSISAEFSDAFDKNLLRVGVVPSLMREGRAFRDFENPELLLIGSSDNCLIAKLSELLSPVIDNAGKVMFITATEAEFIKTSICSMLATRLSLINELASLAEQLDVDINTVVDGMGADERIGEAYLKPGCGFGGLTLPQEVDNILQQLSGASSGSAMLKAVVETNNNQKEVLFRKFWSYHKANISNLNVSVWGASFKPQSSSMANSPIHEIIEALTAQGLNITIYDPASQDLLIEQYGHYKNLCVSSNKYEAVSGTDALFIVTAWDEFLQPDFIKLKQLMNKPLIFDGRNLFEPGELEEFGFEYYAVGRGQSINS
ncbi:UDP binding domain-containing protein [Kangiella geojedonensis]|uniref:UDP-glucose 6-dehydrogenase n=1 Tax=Kangiella geojedonensis TaxID=914150 RepID=A0A0F6RCV1_9GAMM|nr:UDP binding domain-containing protein [Kangiella geojedonensis]AKE52341.1 hypothetical protein TQ33_1391 [Kangiella geojedonensis]